MMTHKRVVLWVLAGILALGLVATALGQAGPAGLVQGQTITVEQAVPVAVTLALPLEDGTVVTATAPITVGIALQVRIEGLNVVSVTAAGPASAAAVAVDASAGDAPAAAPAGDAGDAAGELVDLAGIPYAVETDGPVSITQVRAKESMGGSMTQLVGELRNDGDADLKYVLLSVKFYDADGALLDIGAGAATAETLGPGESSGFQAMASVAFDEVGSYTIEVK